MKDKLWHGNKKHAARARRWALIVRVFAGCGLIVLVSGCFEAWHGPAREEMVVEGVVRMGEVPIQGGWVEFNPMDGAVGRVRSAPIGPDGRFRATGMARGYHAVRIVYPPAFPPVNRLFQSFRTPIRLNLDGKAPLEIDLSRPIRRS
jgi:hypothetical protein